MVYTVCHSVCIFWTHYSMVEPHCSNFRIITAIFRLSELGILQYVSFMLVFSVFRGIPNYNHKKGTITFIRTSKPVVNGNGNMEVRD